MLPDCFGIEATRSPGRTGDYWTRLWPLVAIYYRGGYGSQSEIGSEPLHHREKSISCPPNRLRDRRVTMRGLKTRPTHFETRIQN